MAYNYGIKPTENPLTSDMLYAGRVICFSDVKTNPNNTGILESSKNVPGAVGTWTAVIDGVRYCFNSNGCKIESGVNNIIPVLYGVLSEDDIDPTVSQAKTRSTSEQGYANSVSLKSMSPKDYFACEALNALIIKHPNPLSMTDGDIALLAAKSYKIAQAMATEAYGSRENDKESTDVPGAEYVEVDETSLQTNTERILYNLNESVKAQTNVIKDTGVKVSNINEVDFDGTPTVLIGNTTSSPVNTKEVSA